MNHPESGHDATRGEPRCGGGNSEIGAYAQRTLFHFLFFPPHDIHNYCCLSLLIDGIVYFCRARQDWTSCSDLYLEKEVKFGLGLTHERVGVYNQPWLHRIPEYAIPLMVVSRRITCTNLRKKQGNVKEYAGHLRARGSLTEIIQIAVREGTRTPVQPT